MARRSSCSRVCSTVCGSGPGPFWPKRSLRTAGSPDVFDRFLRELPEFLTPTGRALVVLSSDGDVAGALLAARHLAVRAVRQRDLRNEELTLYELRPAP